jgi:hypothetical protein
VRFTRICAQSPNSSGTPAQMSQRPMDDMVVSPPGAG